MSRFFIANYIDEGKELNNSTTTSDNYYSSKAYNKTYVHPPADKIVLDYILPSIIKE